MDSAATTAAAYACSISPATFAAALGGTGAEPEDARNRAHHLKDGSGFDNPWASYQPLTFKDFFRYMWYMLSGHRNKPDTSPSAVPTVHKPSFLASRATPSLRATWLGHACYLVEFPGGLRVLFDPVFTPHCSPLSIVGPNRYTRAPAQVADIPLVDVVCISHSHYDHLSLPTVKAIAKKFPNVQFFVPLRNAKWFVDSGIMNVTDMDWWESKELKLSHSNPHTVSVSKTENGGATSAPGTAPEADVSTESSPAEILATISCLPCQHIGARGPFDRGKTLWSSWSIVSGGRSVWFSGDTGYRSVPRLFPPETQDDDYGPKYDSLPRCPAFSQIGIYRGPFDLGLISIGAYEPRWLWGGLHANPKDAVNMFVDTKCKRALAMHWGTWVLTDEEVMEPPRKLREALKEKGMQETGVFDICGIGESREF